MKARRTHGRAIARVAMTSAKAFACAMCGAPATMTCGGCAGFAYCAEACLRSHWASGHAEACARVARDVAATAAVRAAHDVDALAWWRVAVVHVDEGLATACDALGACHGVGAFRRECACFRGVPFGTLPRDADDADDADADETFEGADVCMHRAPRSRSRTHSTVVTGVESLSIPANTWLDVYARLGAPRTSRAALAFSAAATTARFAEKVLVRAANERERFGRDGRSNARTNETSSSGQNAFSSKRPRSPFVIHLLGAEKELDQASAFARFLSRVWRGDSFRALVARDVEVHMVGPEVPEGWRPVVSLDGDENGERDDAPRVSVFGHKGLYHDAVREAETRRARENDVRAKTTLATAPDLVVCPDAGIAAFASWVPTIDLVLRLGAPALVTDLTAEAARMAADIWRRRAARMFPTRKNNASAGSSADVALNPFRRVMSARGNDTQAPTYGNGFGFEWVPGEGVEPL